MDSNDWPETYITVIFSSCRAPGDDDAYHALANLMVELVQTQPGFLGFESARGPDRVGITVSYWRDQVAALAWKNVAEHLAAQAEGRARFYESYDVRVAQVFRDYSYPPRPVAE